MIPIVFSTDHNFVMPTGVAIFSMLACAPDEKFDIFVLQSDDVTEEDRQRLKEVVSSYPSQISFISMGTYFRGAFEIRSIPYTSYYRLLIPWLIPRYDKIIYSDGDVIFVDTIKALYDIPLGDHYVAGYCPYAYDQKSFSDYAPEIGVEAHAYINAGILLINAKKQREDKLDDIYLKLAKNKYIFQDQDIINIACKGHIGHLPFRYNVSPQMVNVADRCVLHYAGPKPWRTFTPFFMDWWEVYRRSIFYDRSFENQIVDKILHPVYTQRQLFSLFARKYFPWILTLRCFLKDINGRWNR